jgi:hypothetical protein
MPAEAGISWSEWDSRVRGNDGHGLAIRATPCTFSPMSLRTHHHHHVHGSSGPGWCARV